jgi:ferric-dicitrate binding protein FerR (iron transport regulator)
MDIESYSSYSVEDFLEDQDFRQWALLPDEESQRNWEGLMHRYPHQKIIIEQARLLLQEMQTHFQPEHLREKVPDPAFIASLKDQVRDQQQGSVVVPMYRRILMQRQAIVASVLLLLGMLSWVWLMHTGTHTQTIATRYGEWKTITLADGSGIHLNANSEIRFSDNWQMGADRDVWLKGEAFFEVAKDPQGAKFTVHTEGLAIEVLGTAFNVHSRGEQTEVFLQEGKVRLDMGKIEQVMAPGEFIAFSIPQKAITAFKTTEAEAHTSWKEGSLILRDQTVAAILAKIEEIYGYPVQVENQAMLEEQKTVAIPMDKIELAIPILEKVLNTKIQLKNDQMIVW